MADRSGEEPELTLRPIGYVRTFSRLKFDSPRQPEPDSEAVNVIELLPGRRFELALLDLEGFDRIWLVSWFDRNRTWRPKVLPPRGPAKRRGVFATRSPHRPNPIGLTCVSLLGIEGLTLSVGPLDLTDGTPILDIKPYLRTVDCFPDSGLGWVEEVEAEEANPPRYRIVVGPRAERQLAWLKEAGVDFAPRAFDLLRRDPSPHRTRRILRIDENRFRIACGPWRMYFRLEDREVFIEEVASGLSDESLAARPPSGTDRELHLAFRLEV